MSDALVLAIGAIAILFEALLSWLAHESLMEPRSSNVSWLLRKAITWPVVSVVFVTLWTFAGLMANDHLYPAARLLFAIGDVFLVLRFVHWVYSERQRGERRIVGTVGFVAITLFCATQFAVVQYLQANVHTPLASVNEPSSKPSSGVNEATGTKYDVKVELHRPQKDQVQVTVNKPQVGRVGIPNYGDPPLYTRKTTPFYTYVLFNPYNVLIPFACANSMNIQRLSTCGWIRDLCKEGFHGDPSLVKGACAIALQRFMVNLFESDEQGGFETSVTGTHTFIRSAGTVVNIPNPHRYQLRALLSPEDSRSLSPQYWLDGTVTVPTGTKISFLHVLPGNDPENYVTRLEQKGCFSLDFKITPMSPEEQGVLPDGY